MVMFLSSLMVYIIFFGTFISLIGTMVGASIGLIVKKPSERLLAMTIGFAGGLMLSVVVFELFPEAENKLDFVSALIYCCIGILVIALIDAFSDLNKMFSNTHMKVAFMAALGLMIHNLPEGVIMGCGFVAGESLGFKMSFIIAIHDIPEGIAVSAPLMATNVKAGKILLYAFFTALPTAIGTWIGAYLGSISPKLLGASLAFASGIMIYVVIGEMIPESTKLWSGITRTIGTILGILVGLILTRVL